jgi:hypothetical protein
VFQRRFAILLAFSAVVAAGESTAAVRTCQPAVSSVLSSAATEPLAKKGALDSWVAKAKVYGVGYTSWRLAVNKTLKCVKASSGKFDCIALGTPCTIQQAPGKPKKAPTGKPLSI